MQRPLLVSLALAALSTLACGNDEAQHTLPSIQLAMNRSVAPIYDDEDLTYYEVRREVQLPISAPNAEERAALDRATPPPPFERQPLITLDDVRVQLTWTLTNLDDTAHTVEVLIDPWNEFGRYFPGLMVIDAEEGEYLPNVSGIDHLYILEGKSQGEASRRHGTYTFDDLDELARDFATVMNLIASPPPTLDGEEEGNNGALLYANHAFAVQNRSTRDPLVDPWVPGVIPGLVGFDLALRTEAPATVAIEVIAEVVDRGNSKVIMKGGNDTPLPAPETVITLGSAGPGATAAPTMQ